MPEPAMLQPLVPQSAVRQPVQAMGEPMAVVPVEPVDEAPARQPRRAREARGWSRRPRLEAEKATS